MKPTHQDRLTYMTQTLKLPESEALALIKKQDDEAFRKNWAKSRREYFEHINKTKHNKFVEKQVKGEWE